MEETRRFLLARFPKRSTTLGRTRFSVVQPSGVTLLLFQRRVCENSSRAMTPRNTNYNFASFCDRRRFNEDTASRKQRFTRPKRTSQLTAGKITFPEPAAPKNVDQTHGFRPVQVRTCIEIIT